MPDQEVPDWTQHLAGLVVLGFCAYMTAPPKPGLATLPSVRETVSNPTEQKSRKKKGELSPEVREFMHLPPHIQRQVLDYARNWIDASFERMD